MSITAIAWALSVTTGSPLSKLVLIKLADNANDEGRAWPSIKTIMRQSEISERSVREHLRKLEELGFVRREERFTDGVQLPSIYHMLMPAPPAPPVAGPVPSPIQSPEGVGRQAPTEPSSSSSVSSSGSELVLRDQSSSSTLVAGATEFAEWYKLYPRKVGKPDAERAYLKARKKATAAALLEGLGRYVVEVTGKEQQYISHPATWLNKGRWSDESAAPTLAFDPDKAIRERMSWLDAYGSDGRWIPNTGNGLWKDVHGVGPPPHESDTRVTEADLARFPKAQAMRDKLKGAPRT